MTCRIGRERKREIEEGIIVHEHTIHSSNIEHKSPHILCNMEVIFYMDFDTRNQLQRYHVFYSMSFEMTQQQTCRGQSCSFWMDERYACI